MEFRSLKNIESSFQHIRFIVIVFLVTCSVITIYSVYCAYQFAEAQRQKIYILDQGKSLMLALAQDLTQNRPVEARAHICMFHELFFTIARMTRLLKVTSVRLYTCVIKVFITAIKICGQKVIITGSSARILIKKS